MIFLYSNWSDLSITARHQIAHALGIAKKHPTHVDSNRIVSDGYEMKDIEKALNVENLQAYLETKETDLTVLWEMLVSKVEGRDTVGVQTVKIDDIQPPVEAPKLEVKEVKKRGRTAKK